MVVAVGGNALLERGEVPLADIQEQHVQGAVAALAPLAREHDLVITHGNGPQVGLLAKESALDPDLPHPYPFDVLGAQTQGMIGYFLLQAMENALADREVASLVCQTLVAADDPAFDDPVKFVGPVYTEAEGRTLADTLGWTVRPDGQFWRRVVPSPEPLELLELATIRVLLDHRAVVICAGGGGIPVCRGGDGLLRGVEAVIDKDLGAALMASKLEADALVLLTDVPFVETGFGTPGMLPIRDATPSELRAHEFASGSMGPKVEAACRFVEATGGRAMIGRLADAADVVAATTGTVVRADPPGSSRTE